MGCCTFLSSRRPITSIASTRSSPRPATTAPDASAFGRYARNLRGSATMSRQMGIAELASALERLARALRNRAIKWDAAVQRRRRLRRSTICAFSCARCARPGSDESARVRARVEELDDARARVRHRVRARRRRASPPAPSPSSPAKPPSSRARSIISSARPTTTPRARIRRSACARCAAWPS